METRRKRRRRRRAGPVLLTILFVAVALVAGYKCLVRPPETDVPSSDLEASSNEEVQTSANSRKDYFYTILVYGTDDDNGGSDTNILVGFDRQLRQHPPGHRHPSEWPDPQVQLRLQQRRP